MPLSFVSVSNTSTTSSRPLIPPSSLTMAAYASTASGAALKRPGTTPLMSAITPMVIESSVTPTSVASPVATSLSSVPSSGPALSPSPVRLPQAPRRQGEHHEQHDVLAHPDPPPRATSIARSAHPSPPRERVLGCSATFADEGSARMKLGMTLGYWGASPPTDALDRILEAERLGFDTVFTAESWGSDAFGPLAWWGAHTSTIRLGTSIVQISARTPTACAMHALTLDHLSQGRFVLGLGVSGPQVVEGWYGAPFGKPLARTPRVRRHRAPGPGSTRDRSPTRARTTPSPTRAPAPSGWGSR